MFKRKPEKPDEGKFIDTYKKSAPLCSIYLDRPSSLYSFMVLCLGSVWYMYKFKGFTYVCLLYGFIYEFCNVGQAFIYERIFFARNVKAFSGYFTAVCF